MVTVWRGVEFPPRVSTRYLRLPFTFDRAGLAADLATCLRSDWTRHVNQRDYSGEWTGIALRSATGESADILSVAGIAGYRDTPLLGDCTCFRAILGRFHCEQETVRLLRLAPGGIIHEHRDRGASYADGFFRIHVPIATNPSTRFVVDGDALPMQPGECWYANFALPHSVRNDGTTDRTHLIIDGRRNAWSDRLFAEAGYDFAAEERERRLNPNRAQVIETLRARGTDTDLRLAAELEAAGDAATG